MEHAATKDIAFKGFCTISPPDYKNRDSLPLPMTYFGPVLKQLLNVTLNAVKGRVRV
jgi:hypothetical protein